MFCWSIHHHGATNSCNAPSSSFLRHLFSTVIGEQTASEGEEEEELYEEEDDNEEEEVIEPPAKKRANSKPPTNSKPNKTLAENTQARRASAALVSQGSTAGTNKTTTKRKKSSTKARKSSTPSVDDDESPPPETSPVPANVHVNKEHRRRLGSGSTASTPSTLGSGNSSSTMVTTRKNDKAGKSATKDTEDPTGVGISDKDTDKQKLLKTQKALLQSRKDHNRSLDSIKELNDENDNIAHENSTLKKRINTLIEELSSLRKKDPGTKNQGYSDLVTKKTKRELWRTIKFIGNEKQEREATEKVLDILKIKEFMLTGDKAKDAVILQKRADFINTYSPDVRDGFNAQRSYVQSEMKKRVDKSHLDKDLDPPTVEDVYKVAARDIPPPSDTDPAQQAEHDRLMEIFAWYWDVLLPPCAGNVYWRSAIKTTMCISTANHDGAPCIPYSTEALAALMYDNCREKWIKMRALKKADKKAKIPKKKDDDNIEDFQGKYSDAASGQAKYGGWSSEGLEKFKETRTSVKTGRHSTNGAALERECLGLVRVLNGLPKDMGPPGAETTTKKGKKRKATAAPVLVDFDDEE